MPILTIISHHHQVTIAVAVVTISLVFVRTVGDGGVPAEAAAWQSIRQIHAAQTNYYSQYGRFAGSMDELRPLILDDQLATGIKTGYRFRVQASAGGYEVFAQPLAATTGHSLYSDQTMVLRRGRGSSPVTSASEPVH